jgi:transposase
VRTVQTLHGQIGRESIAACARRDSFRCRDGYQRRAPSVARRYQHLSFETGELDEQLNRLVSEVAPELVAVEGIGIDTAASLLVAGGNPERLRDKAAFAHLCGAAPIPASSGKIIRHRLNRHGNRDARAGHST